MTEKNTTAKVQLFGREAVAYAMSNPGVTLRKYKDPIDPARELTPAQALGLCFWNPRIVYCYQ